MRTTNFSNLQKEVISLIISFTSPIDACRSSAVSPLFRLASEADSVWDSFLPSDHLHIITRLDHLLHFSSKKNLYLSLCNPRLIDHGRRLFWLEKATGRKCYMLSARELAIAWEEDNRYWNWTQLEEGSFFPKVAKLRNVCWLHIRGQLDTRLLSCQTLYAAYLVLRIAPNSAGLTRIPPTVSVALGGLTTSSRALLHVVHPDSQVNGENNSSTAQGPSSSSQFQGHFLRDRGDTWLEVELGQFLNVRGDDGEVTMQLYEKSGHWKRGLIIHGIEIRPKTRI